ncbi:MAG: divalent-cation tolerance protein CutA [Gammaproteobacteria bacterium]|nr:divalent-cation tolerance protein CutA [Gammaproteobacteria bacterium]NNJ84021.1 divalent-cation tolerance protein CutA [Gammaproteobacteria bacterium]
MASFILLRVSTPNQEIAGAIAEELVGKHLAASVHVTGPIDTTYWWKDRIHDGVEWQCEARTHESLECRVMQVIANLHPYEVPEIFSQKLQAITPEYEAWLTRYTTGKANS